MTSSSRRRARAFNAALRTAWCSYWPHLHHEQTVVYKDRYIVIQVPPVDDVFSKTFDTVPLHIPAAPRSTAAACDHAMPQHDDDHESCPLLPQNYDEAQAEGFIQDANNSAQWYVDEQRDDQREAGARESGQTLPALTNCIKHDTHQLAPCQGSAMQPTPSRSAFAALASIDVVPHDEASRDCPRRQALQLLRQRKHQILDQMVDLEEEGESCPTSRHRETAAVLMSELVTVMSALEEAGCEDWADASMAVTGLAPST